MPVDSAPRAPPVHLDTARPTAPDPSARSGPLLEVADLRIDFQVHGHTTPIVRGVNLHLNHGETLAVVGESGSGKSVTARAIAGILDSPPAHVTGGQIRYRGADVLRLNERDRQRLRGEKIAMVFQDAASALNPVLSIGFQLREVLRARGGMSRAASRKRAIELLDKVKIPAAERRLASYPHEFSGGMRQRVMIALAIALDPDVLIADEPTTALDVTVQAQILTLLREIQEQSHMGVILITHDMGVAADVADRLDVMYAGQIVESGPIGAVYKRPAHPYMRALLKSVPSVKAKRGQLAVITGAPPNFADLPSGCAFHPRCPLATERCSRAAPDLLDIGNGRGSRCFYWESV